MEHLGDEKLTTELNGAPQSVQHLKTPDGIHFLRAVDNNHKITKDIQLPLNFEILPKVKQIYWINKNLKILGKQMKMEIIEKRKLIPLVKPHQNPKK